MQLTWNTKQIWWWVLTWTTVTKLKDITLSKTANNRVSKIDINSCSESTNSDNSDNSNNSDDSDNISEKTILTPHTTMNSDHRIISGFHSTIFKILTRISSILTPALKTFINRNEKWSVSPTKTMITDTNWTSLRSVNENENKRITIRSLKMHAVKTAAETAISHWSTRFSVCKIEKNRDVSSWVCD